MQHSVFSSLAVGNNAVTRSRRQQISLDAPPFYHVVSRCVRRVFLCGKDELTGRSFEHRRQLIQDDMLHVDLRLLCWRSGIFNNVQSFSRSPTRWSRRWYIHCRTI